MLQSTRSQNLPKSNYDDEATSLKTVNALYNVCVDLILEHLSNFSESTRFSTIPLSILDTRLAKLSSTEHPTAFYSDLLYRFGGLLRFLEIVTKMTTIDFPRGLEILVEPASHGKGTDWFVRLRQIQLEENIEAQDNKPIHINNAANIGPIIDTTKYSQAQEPDIHRTSLLNQGSTTMAFTRSFPSFLTTKLTIELPMLPLFRYGRVYSRVDHPFHATKYFEGLSSEQRCIMVDHLIITLNKLAKCTSQPLAGQLSETAKTEMNAETYLREVLAEYDESLGDWHEYIFGTSEDDWILKYGPRLEKENLKVEMNLEKYGTVEKEENGDRDGMDLQISQSKSFFPLDRLLQGDSLSKEIMQLYMLKKTPQFIAERKADLLSRIKEGLRMFWPQSNLEVVMFGSAANGLDTADSDLDICIVAPLSPTSPNSSEVLYYDMNTIANVLNTIGMNNVRAIPSAHVPICKFTDPILNLSCDINTNNLLAVENTRLIRAYCSIDKRVAPFIITIKHWARKREINDPAKVGARTLSSYAYVLMALFYLVVICDPPVLPPLQDSKLCSHAGIPQRTMMYHSCEGWIQSTVMWYDREVLIESKKPLLKYGKSAWNVDNSGRMHWMQMNTQTIGALLRDFFEYYSQKFDYGTEVVSLAESKCLSKFSKGWQSDYFGIEDPFILSKNIAAGCKTEQMKWIKQELDRAVDLLNVDTCLDDLCLDYSDEVAQIALDDEADEDLYTLKNYTL